MQAKEGETVDVGDSQSKTVLAEYLQTIELNVNMIYGSEDERG